MNGADEAAGGRDADAVAREAAEGALVRGFAAGDPGAVAAVRRWIRGAALAFRHRLGGELDDVEQEVLLALTEAVRGSRFEGRSSFATYVRRTTLYKCVNRDRRHRRWQGVPVEDLDLAASGPDPEQQAQTAAELRASLRVLAGMSEGCRRLWAMLHDGLTYGEMSAALGLAPGTLRVRVLRCRQKALAGWRELTGASR